MIRQEPVESIESRLEALNIRLSEPPKPSGNYALYTLCPPLMYLSGVTPKKGSVLLYKGKVGAELSKEEGYQAARQCMLNHLNTIYGALGSLDRVERIIKVEGFVNAAPGFNELPYVLNGASDLLAELFGERGIHARSAIGVAELPGGAAVEVEMIVQFH